MFTACGPTKTVAGSQPSTAKVNQEPQATAVRELVGEWTIIDVRGNQVVAEGDQVPTMGFAVNRENPGWLDFYTFNGCNYINGVVALKGSKVARQGDFAATMRMCPDALYEMQISNALEEMQALKVQRINNEAFLYLINAQGETVMTLRKHNLNFFNGAWKVTEVEDQKIPKATGIKMVIDLENQTVHGNAGCNIMNGTVTVNMATENGVEFTNLRTTRMTCPNQAYETLFLQALERAATVKGNDSKATLYDTQGKEVITLSRLSKADLEDL